MRNPVCKQKQCAKSVIRLGVLLLLSLFSSMDYAVTAGSTGSALSAKSLQRSATAVAVDPSYQNSPAGLKQEVHYVTSTTSTPVPTPNCTQKNSVLVPNSFQPVTGLTNTWTYECWIFDSIADYSQLPAKLAQQYANSSYYSQQLLGANWYGVQVKNGGQTILDSMTEQYPNGYPSTTFQTSDNFYLGDTSSGVGKGLYALPTANHTLTLGLNGTSNQGSVTNNTPSQSISTFITVTPWPFSVLAFTKTIASSSGASYTCTGSTTLPINANGWPGTNQWLDCCPSSPVTNPWTSGTPVSVTGNIKASTTPPNNAIGPCGGQATITASTQDTTTWGEYTPNTSPTPNFSSIDKLSGASANSKSNELVTLTVTDTTINSTQTFSQTFSATSGSGPFTVKTPALNVAVGDNVAVTKEVIVNWDTTAATPLSIEYSCKGSFTVTSAMVGSNVYLDCCVINNFFNGHNQSLVAMFANTQILNPTLKNACTGGSIPWGGQGLGTIHIAPNGHISGQPAGRLCLWGEKQSASNPAQSTNSQIITSTSAAPDPATLCTRY